MEQHKLAHFVKSVASIVLNELNIVTSVIAALVFTKYELYIVDCIVIFAKFRYI